MTFHLEPDINALNGKRPLKDCTRMELRMKMYDRMLCLSRECKTQRVFNQATQVLKSGHVDAG